VQIDAQQRATAAANDAWRLAERRYKAGIGSYLEALIVRQQLLVDQERIAELHAEQIDYSVQIIQALGGGFRPGQDVPDPPKVAADANSPALIHHRS
jgi:outer membrane protein TolC